MFRNQVYSDSEESLFSSAIPMHMRERGAERPHPASGLPNTPSASVSMVCSGSQQNKRVFQKADQPHQWAVLKAASLSVQMLDPGA